jgi:hypothetical protein
VDPDIAALPEAVVDETRCNAIGVVVVVAGLAVSGLQLLDGLDVLETSQA